jgi:hypothetical protein
MLARLAASFALVTTFLPGPAPAADEAAVQAAMPTDMAVLYATWVDANPAKATRLSAIVTSYAESAKAWREIVQGLASSSAPPPEALPANPGLRI